jgi:hypothetical protein
MCINTSTPRCNLMGAAAESEISKGSEGPQADGELNFSAARNLAHQTAREVSYRISYIDRSMLPEEQITEGFPRTDGARKGARATGIPRL